MHLRLGESVVFMIIGIFLCENLGVFAEDFGVEADPVVGDEHLALVQDVSLQGARVACRPRRSQLASGNRAAGGVRGKRGVKGD